MIPNIVTRGGFEEWAMATGRVVEEREDHYLIRLFDTAFILCPKSDKSVTPCLKNEFYWESWISLWFLNNLTEEHLFIDIGANCGYYSALASLKAFNVWSFEPNPDYKDLLLGTAEANWVDMSVFPVALSDKSGSATLVIPGDLEGSATMAVSTIDGCEVRKVEVETRRLDEFDPGEDKRPIIIKVDAEGAEEMIWDGSEMFRTMYRPVFFMEYTPGAYSDEFVSKLERYGSLSYIDFNGHEQPLGEGMLSNSADWLTLVVRP